MNATKTIIPIGANGALPIKLGYEGAWLDFEIIGGPFDAYRPGENGDFGVCVRAERVPRAMADLVVPIIDFSVPDPSLRDLVENTVERAIVAAMEGKRVYVGCMGGWGRTGLFLALLAKACGKEDPVGYVRKHYTPHAVETYDQVRYVAAFDVSRLRNRLFFAAWRVRWGRTFPWFRWPMG